MHLYRAILALAVLAGSSQGYLQQNQLCGSSKQCTSSCQDGDFHIMSDDSNSTPYFACKLASKPYYNTYVCSEKANSNDNISRGPCEAVGGELCPSDAGVVVCFLLESNAGTFKSACEDAAGVPHYLSESEQADIECGHL